MVVNFIKLHDKAVLPSYAHPGDAGLDLTAVSLEYDTLHKVWVYGTGLAVEIPGGHVGLLFPRSSIFKQTLSLANCVGVVDSGYRGEVKFMFKGESLKTYAIGDRIGQMVIMPYPTVAPRFKDSLSDSVRGAEGYGSSGN